MTVARLGLMTKIVTAEDDTLGAPAVCAGVDQSTLARNLRKCGQSDLKHGAGARLAYVPVYLIGIPRVRTGVWGISVAGLLLILRQVL